MIKYKKIQSGCLKFHIIVLKFYISVLKSHIIVLKFHISVLKSHIIVLKSHIFYLKFITCYTKYYLNDTVILTIKYIVYMKNWDTVMKHWKLGPPVYNLKQEILFLLILIHTFIISSIFPLCIKSIKQNNKNNTFLKIFLKIQLKNVETLFSKSNLVKKKVSSA